MPVRAMPVMTALWCGPPALNRQLISETRPARLLVLERDTDLRHGPPFRQEDILDRPVEEATGAA
jgi:hypothetical protein